MTMALSTPTTGSRTDPVATVAVVVTIFAWASAFPAIRAGLASFGPLELGAVRFAVAAVPAAIFLAVTRPKLPEAGELWRFGVGGFGFVALYTGLLNYGELTVSAGAASFIINVSPILTALFATAFLCERFSVIAWGGTLLSFAGIGIIALGEGEGLRFDAGALLILGAAFVTSANAIAQKPLFTRHDPLAVAAWNMVVGAWRFRPSCRPALPRRRSPMPTACSPRSISASCRASSPMPAGRWRCRGCRPRAPRIFSTACRRLRP